MKQTQQHSLTSDFRAKASSEEIRERRKTRDAANKRNKENQAALAAWHNNSRDKKVEVPFPERRTH